MRKYVAYPVMAARSLDDIVNHISDKLNIGRVRYSV